MPATTGHQVFFLGVIGQGKKTPRAVEGVVDAAPGGVVLAIGGVAGEVEGVIVGVVPGAVVGFVGFVGVTGVVVAVAVFAGGGVASSFLPVQPARVTAETRRVIKVSEDARGRTRNIEQVTRAGERMKYLQK